MRMNLILESTAYLPWRICTGDFSQSHRSRTRKLTRTLHPTQMQARTTVREVCSVDCSRYRQINPNLLPAMQDLRSPSHEIRTSDNFPVRSLACGRPAQMTFPVGLGKDLIRHLILPMQVPRS